MKKVIDIYLKKCEILHTYTGLEFKIFKYLTIPNLRKVYDFPRPLHNLLHD